MKNLLGIACFTLFIASAFTQQIGINSLYHENISFYNPAYTGSQYQLRGGIQYRNQWAGYDGAPVNYIGQYEQNLDRVHSGIGVNLMREAIGFAVFQNAFLNYRYELELSDVNRLSFGVAGGLSYISFDPQWIVNDASDPQIAPKETQTKFIINTGALLKLNRFSVGLSALQINRPNYDKFNFRSEIHSVLTLDYKWIINRKFNLEPAIFWITDTKYMSLTTLLRANYNNKFWGIAGYRIDDGIVLAAGVIIRKRVGFGYNLDIITSKLSNATSFSHGIFLNYQIQRAPSYPLKVIGTPDF